MAGAPYLVDSNVLLRWIKPDDRDYPLVVSAIDPLFSAVLCSAIPHRTLLNSGTLVLVHLTATGTGFLLRKPIVGRGCLKASCACCRTVWLYIKNGANCLL